MFSINMCTSVCYLFSLTCMLVCVCVMCCLCLVAAGNNCAQSGVVMVVER